MTLFWPIFWILAMLSAIIAFAVTAYRESARQKAAALAMQPRSAPGVGDEPNPVESMENLDGFPTESFDFDDGSLK